MSKRAELDRLPIEERHLHKLMRSLFSKANDYGPFSGSELVEELRHFGVLSRKQARRLLKRHRRTLIDIDRGPVEPDDERVNVHVFGEEFVRTFRRTRVWFAYPALIRIALELEFGDKYRRFADKRDRASAHPRYRSGG